MQANSVVAPRPLVERVLGAYAQAYEVPEERWQRYRVLEGSKGPLVADCAVLRAVAVRDGLPGPAVWVLLRRTLPQPDEALQIKYFLSDAPATTPLTTLVGLSGRSRR